MQLPHLLICWLILPAGTCLQVTRQVQYMQYFVNVHTAALRSAAAQLGAHQGQVPPLGQMLRLVEDQTPRTCDADAGVLGLRCQACVGNAGSLSSAYSPP